MKLLGVNKQTITRKIISQTVAYFKYLKSIFDLVSLTQVGGLGETTHSKVQGVRVFNIWIMQS